MYPLLFTMRGLSSTRGGPVGHTLQEGQLKTLKLQCTSLKWNGKTINENQIDDFNKSGF